MILTSVAVISRVLSNPLGNVFQKQLTNRYNHPLLINFLTFLLLSVFCIIPAIQVRWLELPFEFWKYCILAGIVGATGNGFLVKALQCGDLSVLGPINSYKSVVGIIVGTFLLGEIPNLWGIAGMSLIVYGSYYVLDTMDEHFSLALLKRKEIQYRIWAMVLTAIEAVFIKKSSYIHPPPSRSLFGVGLARFSLSLFYSLSRSILSKNSSESKYGIFPPTFIWSFVSAPCNTPPITYSIIWR